MSNSVPNLSPVRSPSTILSPSGLPYCNLKIGNKYYYDEGNKKSAEFLGSEAIGNAFNLSSGFVSSSLFIIFCIISVIFFNTENKFEVGKIIVYVITLSLLCVMIKAYLSYLDIKDQTDEYKELSEILDKDRVSCDSTNYKGETLAPNLKLS